ncbi:MAG: hypothetical protein WDZ45_01315 [Flavobacteriaceae bacterium]
MKNTIYILILLFLSNCKSGTNYYINNATDQKQTFEVHYISNTENVKEIISPPDSLGITIYSGLANKPYSLFRKAKQKTPFQKINDTVYQFTLEMKEKTMIPYRYYYDNSLKKMVINQKEEILFTEFQHDSDSHIGFKTKNTKLGTLVQYQQKYFIGDDYYIIQFR